MRLHRVRGGSTVRARAWGETLSVIVVSATRVHRDAISHSLDACAGLRVLDGEASVEELTARMGQPPDIVLVDESCADDRPAITRLVEALPEAKVIVLSLPETSADVIPLAEAGVAGFISRDSSVEEMAACLRSAARDELFCSPRVAAILLRRVRSAARVDVDEPPCAALTFRQHQILELIGEGLTNRAIAARLEIEVSTVKNHVHQILDRLQVQRRAQAAARLRAWNARSLVSLALVVANGLDFTNGYDFMTTGIPLS